MPVDSHPEAQRGGVDHWAERALAELTGLPDVSRVGMALLEGGGRRLLFTASDRPRGTPETWCHVDAFAPVPLNDVIRTGTALTADLTGLDPRYESFVRAQHGTGYVSIAAVPVVDGSRPLGGFIVYYGRHQAFDACQRAELDDAASRIAGHLREALRHRTPPTAAHHHPVDGALVAEHEIPPDPAAVGKARRFLRRTLGDWSIDEETTADAVLCLSELVTNALVHTGGGCHVQVELHDGVLTTRVLDNGSPVAPQVSTPGDSLRADGHGLRLVDALTSRWGHSIDPHRGAVWFDLEVS